MVSSDDLEWLDCRWECRHHTCDIKFQNGLCSNPFKDAPTTLLRLISDPCAAIFVNFSTDAPSTSWKFDSDLRNLENSMETIFCQCEVLSLYLTAHHRLLPMGMFSGGSKLSASCAGGWQAIGLPMHGLADSGWPGCNRSGDDGGVICEGQANGRPMPGLESSGWTGATAVCTHGENSPSLTWQLRNS